MNDFCRTDLYQNNTVHNQLHNLYPDKTDSDLNQLETCQETISYIYNTDNRNRLLHSEFV